MGYGRKRISNLGHGCHSTGGLLLLAVCCCIAIGHAADREDDYCVTSDCPEHDDIGCHFEFTSPAMGESVPTKSLLRVEFFAVGCSVGSGLSEEGDGMRWPTELIHDGKQVYVYAAERGTSFTIHLGDFGKGYHTLFARAMCGKEDEGEGGDELLIGNGTGTGNGMDTGGAGGGDAGACLDINGTALYSAREVGPDPNNKSSFVPGHAVPSPVWMMPPNYSSRSSGSARGQARGKGHGRGPASIANVPREVLDQAAGDLLSSSLAECNANPDDFQLLARLGRVQMALGMVDEAIDSYEKALREPCIIPCVDERSSAGGIEQLDACISLAQALSMRGPLATGVSLQAAYGVHFASLVSLEDSAKRHIEQAQQVIYAVVSGSSFLATRASAAASTWLTLDGVKHSYIYSDAPGIVTVCPEGGDDDDACSSRSVVVPPVNCPSKEQSSWLSAISYRDDFFSSVPKFILALLDMHRRHPDAPWYYMAGCDTYLLPGNLAGALEGVDSEDRVVVGGHGGLHGGSISFLSGGSGLVISNGFLRAFEPVGCSLLRDWIEVSGPARNCAPCADIAIVHFAAVLGAKLIDRGCFYAFWPEYYALTGYASTGGWRGQQNLPEGCRRALEGGDGTVMRSESVWWGRQNHLCSKPVAFHYLQPRAMRLIHSHVAESMQ